MDYFVANPGQQLLDTTWYPSINDTMPVVALKQSLLLPLLKDNFTINYNSNPLKLSFASGLQCTILPSILIAGGQAVSCSIDVRTILLKKKGDMIRMDRPTISNGNVLVSGGSFYLDIKKDGAPVSLSGTIGIQYADTNLSSSMKLFSGDTTNAKQFNWIPLADSSISTDSVGYSVITQKLNWLNCDYFYDTTAPKTMVAASLPNYFTNATTTAFLAFNDMRSVVGMYGTAATKQFSSGSIPTGKAVTVIAVSKQGNDYYMGHQTTITAAPATGLTAQIVAVSPVKTTLDAIKLYLDSL